MCFVKEASTKVQISYALVIACDEQPTVKTDGTENKRWLHDNDSVVKTIQINEYSYEQNTAIV